MGIRSSFQCADFWAMRWSMSGAISEAPRASSSMNVVAPGLAVVFIGPPACHRTRNGLVHWLLGHVPLIEHLQCPLAGSVAGCHSGTILAGGGRGCGHFDGGNGGVVAFVAVFSACAVDGLLLGVRGQNSESHRNPGLELHAIEPAGGLSSDVIKMRRVTANHGAQRDDRIAASCARRGSWRRAAVPKRPERSPPRRRHPPRPIVSTHPAPRPANDP